MAHCESNRLPRRAARSAHGPKLRGPTFPLALKLSAIAEISSAYRTGRGSISMRAVVTVEEIQGRTCLVVTELPYQVNPDNLAMKIADLG